MQAGIVAGYPPQIYTVYVSPDNKASLSGNFGSFFKSSPLHLTNLRGNAPRLVNGGQVVDKEPMLDLGGRPKEVTNPPFRVSIP